MHFVRPGVNFMNVIFAQKWSFMLAKHFDWKSIHGIYKNFLAQFGVKMLGKEKMPTLNKCFSTITCKVFMLPVSCST